MDIFCNVSEERLYDLLAKHAEILGYEIVRIRMFGGGHSSKLQIMIERVNGTQIAIEDCEKVSRAFSIILDAESDLDFKYNLEISSVGINRPLTRRKDFENNVAENVEVKTYNVIDNTKTFRGRLTNCNECGIRLEILDNKRVMEINFDLIKEASLLKI